MDLRRLRFAEYIPPAPVADARRLSSLPTSWARPIPESTIDGLLKRADAMAGALQSGGDGCSAKDVRRAATMLRQSDALHAQAERLETLAQLYVALTALRADLVREGSEESEEKEKEQLSLDASMGLLQAGALPTAGFSSAHGPAFRETAALRSRAFRQLEAAMVTNQTKLSRRRSR